MVIITYFIIDKRLFVVSILNSNNAIETVIILEISTTGGESFNSFDHRNISICLCPKLLKCLACGTSSAYSNDFNCIIWV